MPTHTAHRWPFQSAGKTIRPEAVEAAWQEYRATRSADARETLVQRYLHLVRYMAGRLSRTLPPSVEFDDLVSSGLVGFLSALDSFDPDHGTDFSVYALTRIRGAMVDFVREIDPIGRVTRRKLRAVERTLVQLEQELSRPPSATETAARLGITTDTYHELMSQATAAMTLSLERIQSDGDDDGVPGTRAWVADTATKDPLTTLADKDDVGRLAGLVGTLSSAQQLVLHLHYVEELNFREVAMAMDISESRATQLHTAAVLALRSQARGCAVASGRTGG
ncbi:MAG TPA: FliA/WhiG family RNA polymerase sigma factor [Methylomirabilota bacterium]|nr:FliA/WhiG family RNA polymerase sigma factor [Methylomirabilota bacterium]